jgi:aspartyl-tRNA(Asn)/glutamyl-tRNA(Gln) amidotransferase subunit A
VSNRPDITVVGTELASEKITSTELLARHLEKIKKFERTLNCFVSIDEARAKQDAHASDRRYKEGSSLSLIDGIPIALKDNIHVNGQPTCNGTSLMFPFGLEAEVARKLRAAGAILLGKLNMDECALGAITDNPHHGRTHNPWRMRYIPGGSSGGAGAAVAGGMVMAALGTDTLGSVRLPAAYCGLVGLKPTLGLISTDGVVLLSPTFDHVGPICLSVRDTILLLNILVDKSPNSWSYDPKKSHDLMGLRIGVLEQILASNLTEEVSGGFEKVKAELRQNGATLTSLSIPRLNLRKLRQHAFLIIEKEGSEALAGPLQDHSGSFSESLKVMLDYGRYASREKIEDALTTIAEVKAETSHVFDGVDLLISPTAPQAAFPFDGPIPDNQADLTALSNVCGYPAITIPSGLDSSGMPLAVQVIAPAYQEAILFGAAMAMENMWGSFIPPLTANL